MVGIVYYGSNNTVSTGNNATNNMLSDISQVDITGIVTSSDVYTCGPAALATVLNKMGINVTEDEIIDLAGTEDSGTTMYGLQQAALTEVLIAKGMIIPVSGLRADNIVFITFNGVNHYSVVTNITNTTIYLADPVLGNINMTIANFTAIYSGDVLIVTNNSSDPELTNGTALTTAQMQSLLGQGWWDDLSSWGNYAYGQLCSAGRYISNQVDTLSKVFSWNFGAGGQQHSPNGTNSSWYVSFNGTARYSAPVHDIRYKIHVRYLKHWHKKHRHYYRHYY